MTNKIRITSRAFLLLLIPVTMLLFHNQLSNWHYHVLGNGILIKHAHPCSKADKPGTPFNSHKHTDFEFFILGQLASLTLLVILFFIAFSAHLYQRGNQILCEFLFPFLQQQHLSLKPLRAPPYL
jgi:hypothetical protein